MLAAFVLYPKKKKTALLLFSISLALKQIGIFAAPLFVIWAYIAEDKSRNGLMQAVKSAAMIASISFVSSIPFFVWNLEGFARSIIFSATRLPDTHIIVSSLDALLGWEGLPARIPMVVLFLTVYWMAARGVGGKYLPVVLLFNIFIGFNAVLFNQYFVWLIAFVPLMISDYLKPEEIRPASDLTTQRSG